MARFEVRGTESGAFDASTQAEILFEMGMMYATGRDCDVDLVAAHKWFNIAAVKGCERAAIMRNEISVSMSKVDLATALRAAREWMTAH
ncbi:SEL1-like repeat protein [Brucella sp. IR073]|uniref:SEL1-like repeat protein n=1 Tax=unclassified Brucella TaxID=2632610 RepID=UPI003B97FB5A